MKMCKKLLRHGDSSSGIISCEWARRRHRHCRVDLLRSIPQMSSKLPAIYCSAISRLDSEPPMPVSIRLVLRILFELEAIYERGFCPP